MPRSRARQAWITAFVVIAFLPAILRALSPERQLLGPEIITITGLLATVLLVTTVVLPSRLRSLTRAFGIETVLRHHRSLGMATALSTLAHVAAVLANDPRGVGLLLPFLNPRAPAYTTAPIPLLTPLLTPPGRALFGLIAAACLVGLAALSARRTGSWERWRFWHLGAAVGALLGTALHILLIGHLLPTPAVLNLLLGDPLGWTTLRAATQDPLAAGFLVLLALVVLVGAVRRWAFRPAAFRVVKIGPVAENVTSIVLRPLGRGFRFRPGQFIWLRLAKSQLLSEEHPFTLSSATQDRPTIELTIKDTGNWTARLRRLRPGDLVYVDGPHGSFTPNLKSRRGLVMICGGVGITPMMSMLRSAAGTGSIRSYRLILTDRPGQGLFRDELTQLMTRLDLLPYELAGRRLSPEVLGEMLPPPVLRNQLDYYVCGPPRLVREAVAALDTLEVPARRIHTELFE